MLNQATFVKELRALADRFNRTISDEMARRYYQDLKQLDTRDFLDAARVIYRNDTFWPAPARFLEAIGIDATSEAELAWENTLTDATNGTVKPLSEYTPAQARALRAIGGINAIGHANTDRLPFIKRDFVNAYKQHAQRDNLPELDAPEPVEIAGVL